MKTLNRVMSIVATLGFLFGGVACSSSPETSEDMTTEAMDSMEQSADQTLEDNSGEFEQPAETSYDEPVEQIAQDSSFQEDTYDEPSETSYSEPTYEEPQDNNVSLGASSSGLGK